jgi:predicted transcriptional regulator
MSEFAKLMDDLSEEEKEKKISMIDKSKNILKRLITTGYWKIIDYMQDKVGPDGISISELANALGMTTGDVRYKLKVLEELRIVKHKGKAPATTIKYRGGRPKEIYAKGDLWSYDEISELKRLKRRYEEPVAEKLQKKLEKWIKQKTVKGKTEVNEF